MTLMPWPEAVSAYSSKCWATAERVIVISSDTLLRLVRNETNRDSRRTPTYPQGLVPAGPTQAPQGFAVTGVFPGRSCRVSGLRGFIQGPSTRALRKPLREPSKGVCG